MPYGCWQSVSEEGVVETRAIYDKNGRYQQVHYYPDGSPRFFAAGRIAFKDGKVEKKDDETLAYAPTGEAFAVGELHKNYIERISGKTPLADGEKDIVCDYSFWKYGDGKVEGLVFVLEKKRGKYEPAGKIEAQWKCGEGAKEAFSGFVERIYYGDYRLSITRTPANLVDKVELFSNAAQQPIFCFPMLGGVLAAGVAEAQ